MLVAVLITAVGGIVAASRPPLLPSAASKCRIVVVEGGTQQGAATADHVGQITVTTARTPEPVGVSGAMTGGRWPRRGHRLPRRQADMAVAPLRCVGAVCSGAE
jgi:hypothetical protein